MSETYATMTGSERHSCSLHTHVMQNTRCYSFAVVQQDAGHIVWPSILLHDCKAWSVDCVRIKSCSVPKQPVLFTLMPCFSSSRLSNICNTLGEPCFLQVLLVHTIIRCSAWQAGPVRCRCRLCELPNTPRYAVIARC